MAEDPRTAYYSIIDLTSPKGRRDVYSRVLTDDRQELAGLRVLEVAMDTARSAVVEHLYVDRDYTAAYSRFYSRVFRRVKKWCERIHFFSCTSQTLNLVNLSENSQEYLGFTVVRPLSTFKTGRTVLAPPVASEEEFHLAVEDHRVNVAGSPLTIHGAAFLEQDTRTAACASAAIWMASEGYVDRLGLGRATSTQITELATAYDVSAGRAMPSEGLTTGQMLQAFRGLGLDPVLYQKPNREVARSRIYSYVESRLPVVIGIQLVGDTVWHAVTAVGHTFDPKRKLEKRTLDLHDGSQVEYQQSSGFAGSFIVNDDQRGPYRKMRLLEDAEYPPDIDPQTTALFELECSSSVPGGPSIISTPVYGIIHYIMVPLPAGVSLQADEAEAKAAYWIHGIPLVLPSARAANALRRKLNLSELVLRTYLQSSNEFKGEMSKRRGMNDHLRGIYRTMPLPRNVWVTEISTLSWMSRAKSRRLMCGEILNDCSGNPYTASFVSIHLPGYFVRTGPEHGDPDLAVVEDLRRVAGDVPYAHLSR